MGEPSNVERLRLEPGQRLEQQEHMLQRAAESVRDGYARRLMIVTLTHDGRVDVHADSGGSRCEDLGILARAQYEYNQTDPHLGPTCG